MGGPLENLAPLSECTLLCDISSHDGDGLDFQAVQTDFCNGNQAQGDDDSLECLLFRGLKKKHAKLQMIGRKWLSTLNHINGDMRRSLQKKRKWKSSRRHWISKCYCFGSLCWRPFLVVSKAA